MSETRIEPSVPSHPDFDQPPVIGMALSVHFEKADPHRAPQAGDAVPFGAGFLVLSGFPPSWLGGLLTEISEIGELRENWDSYGARPIDPGCAEATANLLLAVLDPATPRPALVPTSGGGIQVEWHRAGADLEIRVESPARVEVFFADEREGTETETVLTTDLRPLARFLKRIGEAN